MFPGQSLRAVFAVASLACVAGAAACSLGLEGLGAETDAGAPRDASVAEEGGAGEASVDAYDDGLDATVPLDAPPESTGAGEGGDQDAAADGPGEATTSPDACVPIGPENCTDGLDDDCNGLVDCADPACVSAGYVCGPAVPSGWTLVGYDRTARPSCASGWGSSSPTVEGPDGGSACTCTCGSYEGNPCLEGTLSLSLGQNQCGCAQTQNMALASDGGCDLIGHAIGEPCGTWGDGKVAALAPVTLACSETRTLPTLGFAAQGETCVPSAGIGAGCSGGGSCIVPPAPAAACVEQAGVQAACPAGFSTISIVYAPGDVTDERQCGPCGCVSAATSCDGGVVTLFDDPACTVSGVAVTANGQCNGITGDPSDAGWFLYKAVPDTTACTGPATSPLDGGLLAANPKTICCP